MNAPYPNRLQRHSPALQGGFSLVEIAMALGIIAFALLSILGLMQVGLTSLKANVDDTVTSLILHHTRCQLDGTAFVDRSIPSIYYDVDCRPLAVADVARARYRVDVAITTPQTPPAATNLKTAVVTISWPVVGTSGQVVGGNAARVLKTSLLVTPGTAANWVSYQPKIDL